MEIHDFRSDTVTKPTPEMREVMAQAEVGDDVFGEDPTVNKLEEKSAEMMGMEAGLFVPSGSMGNMVSVLAHCNRGDEIILGIKSHIFRDEAGGIAAIAGVNPFPLQNQIDGTILLDEVENAIRVDNEHYPITKLISIENTQNKCGGASLTVEYTQAISQLAKDNDLKLHIDGARIFNAAVNLDVAVKDLTSPADSVTFCLSKGLSAPVGSVVCGTKEFIYKAHRARKQLGGGMRQAGILASAGIVALDQMVDRLSEDHLNAKKLAKGLAEIDGLDIDLTNQHTNMVYFNLNEAVTVSPIEFENKVAEYGVLINDRTNRRFRMVTHAWVDGKSVERAIDVIAEVIANY